MPKTLASITFCVPVCFFTALSLVQFAALQPQPQGRICGTVQNEEGAPAAFVRVEAVYLGAHSGMYGTARTNKDGLYCIEHVRPGEYAMSADDAALGYPVLASLFYLLHIPEPPVIISASSPHQIANWSIPYKAGSLHVHATDRTTGKVVRGVSLYLAVRGSENLRYMFGGWKDNTALLPPNEDIYVTVKANGYRPWPTAEQKGYLVTIQPGASLDLSALMDATTEP